MLNIRDNIAELRGILLRLIDDRLKQPHPAHAALERERAERLLDEIQMAWDVSQFERHYRYEYIPQPLQRIDDCSHHGAIQPGPGREIA